MDRRRRVNYQRDCTPPRLTALVNTPAEVRIPVRARNRFSCYRLCVRALYTTTPSAPERRPTVSPVRRPLPGLNIFGPYGKADGNGFQPNRKTSTSRRVKNCDGKTACTRNVLTAAVGDHTCVVLPRVLGRYRTSP